MNDEMSWVVRSSRTGSILYGTPTLSEANAIAYERNSGYQTDEYRVEKYEPAWGVRS